MNQCFSTPCQNGGTCTDGINRFTCACLAGYNGTTCENNINECASSPCQNGGTCNDAVNGYTCDCEDGYNGTLCENDIDECASAPCQNGGTCTDEVDGYTCDCPAGYGGDDCDDIVCLTYEDTIDNEDSAEVTIEGTWTTSSTESPYIGTGYLHNGNTGRGSKSVTFKFNITQSGMFKDCMQLTVLACISKGIDYVEN